MVTARSPEPRIRDKDSMMGMPSELVWLCIAGAAFSGLMLAAWWLRDLVEPGSQARVGDHSTVEPQDPGADLS